MQDKVLEMILLNKNTSWASTPLSENSIAFIREPTMKVVAFVWDKENPLLYYLFLWKLQDI